GDAERDLRVDDLAFRAHDPLRDRRLRHHERASDLGGGETDDRALRERELRIARQSRMAAGEDEIEALVPGRPRDRWTARHRPLLEERELFAIACVATEAIDGFASRRRREPRRRIVGNAVA